MSQIPRRSFPKTLAEFDALSAAGRPVILEDAAADWKCTHDWSLDYLKKVVGHKETLVTKSDNPLFMGDPKHGHYTADQMTKMPFGDFLDSIAAGHTPGRHLYAHKQDILNGFPELREDIQIPEFIRNRGMLQVTLWMGPTGSNTQVHHDMTDNLFTMIRGRKKVTLINPYTEARVPRFPFKSHNGKSSWHLSLKGTFNDGAGGEEFAGLEKLEAVMEPGDMLFIPTFWWHEVLSLDQPSISLAFWWDARPWAAIEQAMQRITALAEEYQSGDPRWQAFIQQLLEKDVFGRKA